MDRSERALVRKYLRGERVPPARLKEIEEAEGLRLEGDGAVLLSDYLHGLLDDLRHVGPEARRGPAKKARGR